MRSDSLVTLRTGILAALGLLGCEAEITAVPIQLDCSDASPTETDTIDCGGVTVREKEAICSLPPELACGATGGECTTAEECLEFSGGDSCLLGPGDGCSCFTGCTADDDCGEGSVCHCGPRGGVCARADTCRTSSDCEPGEECVVWVSTDECGGGATFRLSCTTDEDLCLPGRSSCQCEPSGPGGAFECSGSNGCDIGGRPFLVAGAPRVAPPTRNGERVWSSALLPDVEALSADRRRLLAERWTHLGQLEHASIAAFARFAMQLLSLGAPAELLADTSAAMQDELIHARLAFGLASAYAGEPIGPGPLAVDGALDDVELEEIVGTLFEEGCVGETFAAVVAQQERARACDPVVRGVLSQIASDEQRHGLLAWRALSWMLSSERGDVAAAVLAKRVERCERELAGAEEAEPPTVRAGTYVLTSAEVSWTRARVLGEVVLPCARGLLLSHRSAARPVDRAAAA
jgi:hypothetical protein